MASKLPTVSIGIPAHNEAHNIGKLLESILLQKKSNFSLKEIVVICDGCTDGTELVVNSYRKKNKLIRLVNDGKRLGKFLRLNQIFKNTIGDILICLDADVQLANRAVILETINCFNQDNNIGLVGGNDKPLKPITFTESVVVTWIKHWQRMVKPINNWVNPLNNPGRYYALSRSFANKLYLPPETSADDHFVFFKAIQLHYKFKYSSKSIVFFRAPGTLIDFFNQSVRFGKAGSGIRDYFGTWIDEYHYVSSKAKRKAYISSMLKEPELFSIAILVQVGIKIFSKFSHKKVGGVWAAVASSK